MAGNQRSRQARTLAALGATAAVFFTSCSNGNEGGTALPATPTPDQGTESVVPPANVFGQLDACDVLEQALEGEEFPPGSLEQAGGDNGCDTTKAQFGTVGVTFQPNLAIDDLNADPSQTYPGKINNRRAMQVRNAIRSEGDCMIAIEVTETSRALVVSTLSTGTTDEACAFATEVAEKIEPQLPKGN